MQISYWEQHTFFRDLDVIVVGSGIVGLSTALALKMKDPALRILILERGFIPSGASTRNAGFACFGSVSELIEDIEREGESAVFHLVEQRWRGLQRLRQWIGDEAMHFKGYGGYELFQTPDAAQYERCAAHLDGFNARLKDITGLAGVFAPAPARIGEFGFREVTHMIYNRAEGQLHPGYLVQALLRKVREMGVEVINGLGVQSYTEDAKGVTLIAKNDWVLRSRQLVVATNGFAKHLLPQVAVEPARNQVVVTKPIKGLPFKGTFHYDRGYFYFRNIGERVLLGGGRNLDLATESTELFGPNPLIRNVLLRMLRDVIAPGQPVEVEQWWSGILGIGGQKQPIIERPSPRVVVAVRLGGMGVALGSLVGERAAELLLEA